MMELKDIIIFTTLWTWLLITTLALRRASKLHKMSVRFVDIVMVSNVLDIIAGKEPSIDVDKCLPSRVYAIFYIPLALWEPVENFFDKDILEREFSVEEISMVVDRISYTEHDFVSYSKKLSPLIGDKYVRRTGKPYLRIVK
jgi:hypothetical protein